MRPFTLIFLLLLLPLSAHAAVKLELVAKGFQQPTYVVPEPAPKKRLLVVEQRGRVAAAATGEQFLDITGRVRSGGEMGLLSIAFHPRYSENGKLYANYTTGEGKDLRTVISEFHISGGGKTEDTERVLLTISQPYTNHNGGQLAFGPDGFLYIGMGDGGAAGDPHGHGQNMRSLLGKMLRLDVNKDAGAPEIWASGLRNPWRFSFDRETGELWAADVGQNAWEEIHVIEKGKNYGWNVFEGKSCFQGSPRCSESGFEPPVWVYGREEGISITGGYVYRGKALPELSGAYVYGDFGSGKLWALRRAGGVRNSLLLDTELNISSFGQDLDGELYVVSYSTGEIFRIAPPSLSR